MTFGKFVLRLFVSTVLVMILVLLVDPQYFDRPLAEGEAGLAAHEAPVGAFATTIGVEIPDGSQIVSVFLKARDVALQIQGEFLDPQGNVIVTGNFQLASDTQAQKARWATWAVPPRGPGKHVLRFTQNTPGRVALYFYQGPFWERMMGLPLVMVLLNLIILFVRRNQTEK